MHPGSTASEVSGLASSHNGLELKGVGATCGLTESGGMCKCGSP